MTYKSSVLCPTLNPRKELDAASTTTSKIASGFSKAVKHFLPSMTIQKKKVKDGVITEVKEEEITNPWLRLVLGQHGWKLIILLLIATQHPLGRGILSSLGFDWQDTKKISVAAEEAKATKTEVTSIAETVKEIKLDVSALKANNAILNTKVDSLGEKQTALEQTFRGFQVDWAKWKPKPEEPKQ